MNKCESINSMELNETKRTFSLSSIHKNFQIYKKRVENGCHVYTSQSHQCNSRNISEYDSSKGFHDSILENRKFTHRKQRNTLQNNSMRPDLFV